MHASIACLFLYEDYVRISLGNAMKAKQSNTCTGIQLSRSHEVRRGQPEHTHTSKESMHSKR